jgi:hypothetical protein
MNKTKLSLAATVLVVALFLFPSATAVFASSQSLSARTVAFKVVNTSGTPQAHVFVQLEINSRDVARAITGPNGMVTFNLAHYSPSARIQADFEKGMLQAEYLSTVGATTAKTVTITLHIDN